jgi:isopropylmalate/homocitrate/citramalate synthase
VVARCGACGSTRFSATNDDGRGHGGPAGGRHTRGLDECPYAARTNAARGTKKKTKISINNENLAKSGGHITSGSANPAALPPTPPAGIGKTVEQMVAEADAERKAIAEKEKKKAAEEQRKRMERAVAAQDDNALDANDDPAVIERRMQAAAQGQQTTTNSGVEKTTTQKPPV